jgi:hypothetical protein
MTAERIAGRAVFWAMAALTLGYLAQLSQRADRASYEVASVRSASHAILYLDRAKAPPGLVSGWSRPEPGVGTWSAGERAVLRLTGLTPGAVRLAITLQPFNAPGVPVQHVAVSAHGRRLAEWRLTASRMQTLTFEAPQDAREANGDLELTFDLPDADSPARRVPGSGDARQIAVKLVRLEASSR